MRLSWVEYLLLQTDIKKSRIGFEAPVTLPSEQNSLRADIIIYDKALKPEILVECKSTTVALTEETGKQAARYNTKIGAPSICLTNGVVDLWYKIDDDNIVSSEQAITEIEHFNDLTLDTEWWYNRGFISNSGINRFDGRMAEICHYFYGEHIEWPLRFLDFQAPFLSFSLSHYYKVASLDEASKLAISFIRTHNEQNLMIAVLNVDGMNTGFLIIDLEKLYNRTPKSATLYNSRKQINIDAHKHVPLFEEKFNPSIIENLPNFLISLFD